MSLKDKLEKKLEQQESESKKNYEDKTDEFINDVDKLFKEIESWIKDYKGINNIKRTIKKVNEELAAPYEIDILEFDILNIKCTLEPIGLWVIGSRGRIDLKMSMFGDEKYLIIRDIDSSHWNICFHRDRKNIEAFTQEKFEEILESWVDQWA